MITKPVPALLCTPTGHTPTSRTPPELATALGVGYMWAFSAMSHSPGARAHYDRRREAGDRHTAAQRNLFNRMIGCLHHCLTHHVPFGEAVAFPTQGATHLSLAA